MQFNVELSELAEKQYLISFAKHRYLLVYRVTGSRVIIEGIYHELQDYENSIM